VLHPERSRRQLARLADVVDEAVKLLVVRPLNQGHLQLRLAQQAVGHAQEPRPNLQRAEKVKRARASRAGEKIGVAVKF
jgi:hypothetical protein